MKNLKKRTKTKTVFISIRVTPKLKQWLNNQNYSITKVFHHACESLGYKGDDQE